MADVASHVDLTVTVRDYGGHPLGTGVIPAARACPAGECDPRRPVGVGSIEVRLRMANGKWHTVGTYGPRRALWQCVTACPLRDGDGDGEDAQLPCADPACPWRDDA